MNPHSFSGSYASSRDFLHHGFAVVVSLLLALVLTGCGTRPSSQVLKTVGMHDNGGKIVSVYVATTRSPDEHGLGFSDGKARETHYLKYQISIPPSHKTGEIEYPEGSHDPAKSFVVISRKELTRPVILAELRQRRAAQQEVGVFVHGFNYSFQESLFRLAQMSVDSQMEGVPILFSWPSRAAVSGYVADKEAATYSRDALAGLLSDLAGIRFAKTVVFGHSMGAWLTAESLRQLHLTGKQDALDRLTVVLAAPDIDMDVFRKQMESIGRLPTPMTILVSSDDRALKVSGLLAGDTRVGELDVNNPEVASAAKRLNISIVDISELPPSDGLNHDRYVALASVYGQLSANGQPDAVRRAGAFVFSAVGKAVSNPFALASSAMAGN